MPTSLYSQNVSNSSMPQESSVYSQTQIERSIGRNSHLTFLPEGNENYGVEGFLYKHRLFSVYFCPSGTPAADNIVFNSQYGRNNLPVDFIRDSVNGCTLHLDWDLIERVFPDSPNDANTSVNIGGGRGSPNGGGGRVRGSPNDGGSNTPPNFN